MIKYLLFILIISCTSKVDYPTNNQFALNTRSEIQVDTIWWNAVSGLQYQGEWRDKDEFDYGRIADKTTENSVLIYEFTGVGIDVYTYGAPRHFGYTISIDGERSYVDLSFDERKVRKTWSVSGLRNVKHRIVITPDPRGTFVFVKLVKFVDTKPDWIDTGCIPDTVYIVKYLQPIQKIFIVADSLILELK